MRVQLLRQLGLIGDGAYTVNAILRGVTLYLRAPSGIHPRGDPSTSRKCYPRPMSKLCAALASLALLTTPAAASALRIPLNKATQATSPLKYAVHTATMHGLVMVELELPRKQAPLDHLWRIDVVMRKGDKTQLDAPLQTKLDGDNLKTDLLLDPGAMQGTEIWIRTGENAPLAETIYAIDVGSFK